MDYDRMTFFMDDQDTVEKNASGIISGFVNSINYPTGAFLHCTLRGPYQAGRVCRSPQALRLGNHNIQVSERIFFVEVFGYII